MMERLPFGYSLLAPGYDISAWACSLGALPHAQRILLHALPEVHNLLIVGGGTGLCLRSLPWERVDGQVTFVDIAPGMIRRARRVAQTLGVARRIQFFQKRAEQLDPQLRFDALYTPFFLDQFPQGRCEAIMRVLDAVLAPGGVWLHVDFTLDGKEKEARLYRAVVIPFLYKFFHFICGVEASSLPNPRAFWQEQRYVCQWQAAYARAAIESYILKKPEVV